MSKRDQIIVYFLILSLTFSSWDSINIISNNSTSISRTKTSGVYSQDNSYPPHLQSIKNLKDVQQVGQNNTQNISSTNFTGFLPNSINLSKSHLDVPMLYSTTNSYDLKLNSSNEMNVSQPANVSLNFIKKNILYGIDFAKYNSTLAVSNSTLTSPNAAGISQYFYNKNKDTFNFTASGYGGSILSSFNITSFNNINIFNPFSTPLIFNSTFDFRNVILPSNGLNYTYYIDFLFNPNSSVVNSPFLSVIRLNLLYTSNYADNTLFSINNSSDLMFYLNSNSNINVLLKNLNFNGSTSMTFNISDLLTQVKQSLNIKSIQDYFSSFNGVEIGFFSYNSTNFRSVNLNIKKFTLYNILSPSQYLVLSGVALTDSQPQFISSNLFKNPISIKNCIKLNLNINLRPNYKVDQNLFFSKNPLNFLINISFLQMIPFKVEITKSNLLNWSSNILNFPDYSFNSSNFDLKLIYMVKNIFWFIDDSWLPDSLPTKQNGQFFANSSNILSALSQNFQQNVWFGGLLSNDFFQRNFSVSFFSKNSFSPLTIQGFILDDKLNLTFSNNQDFDLAKYIILYLNNSDIIVPYLRLYVNNNKGFISITIPIFNQSYLSNEFLLFVSSDNIKNGFFLQSFFITNILKNYDGGFSCSFQTDNSTIRITRTFNFSLNCIFNNKFYSLLFLKKLLININIDNVSSNFPFDIINFDNNSMLFQRQIYIPNENDLYHRSFIVLYSIINLFSPVQTILWSNSSEFSWMGTVQSINDQISIYSNWPFYGFFSILILLIITIRRRKTQSIIKNQIS